MFEYTFNMAETLSIAVVLLLLGRYIKSKVSFFTKYFIPAPVIGGLLFSIFTLTGHINGWFSFKFDSGLSSLLMIMFFTSVGFMASFRLLATGGYQVFIFLIIASILAVFQNGIGVGLAQLFGINPLIGVAAGSVPLTGGHGTSSAFGPVLEAHGATGASTIAIAAATYGLVAGCMIGGPIAKRLMTRFGLQAPSKEEVLLQNSPVSDHLNPFPITEKTLFNGVFTIIIAMAIGTLIGKGLGKFIVLPAYIGPMIAAAIIRNISDARKTSLPMNEISIVGNISLTIFLSIAMMSMRLWELAALAVPLIVILLVQTLFMGLYAYFITFNIMGRDYDAAVMSSGHCGFGLGATPNAMANMESFTSANGPSPKSFMVIPLVGALFIDFVNALIITFFVNIF